MSNKTGKTRQGVRDLSQIGSRKSQGLRLDMPPDDFMGISETPTPARHREEEFPQKNEGRRRRNNW